MAASCIAQCRTAVTKLRCQIQQILSVWASSSYGGHSLALDVCPTSAVTPSPFSQESLTDNGFLWAVPKNRRSYDKKMTRKFGCTKIRKYMTPKRKLVSCLECGHWHESYTICGNCYKKVKEETEEMIQSMSRDDFHYRAPQTEVVYVYEGEEPRPKHEGKYIVEMKKPRPQWWSANLLTKARS